MKRRAVTRALRRRADGELSAVGERDEAHELVDNLEGGLRHGPDREELEKRGPDRSGAVVDGLALMVGEAGRREACGRSQGAAALVPISIWGK
jgi:hypothetical protein